MRYERLLISTAAVLGFLVLWEVAARQHWIDPNFFGQPTGIWSAAFDVMSQRTFGRDAMWSLSEFTLGFALAVVIGVPLGLVVGYYKTMGELFDPLLMAFNSTPRTALIPLILMWFGVGIWAKASVVFLGALFPIALNVASGMTRVDQSWVKAARSFGCSERQIFRYILLPGSLPYLMTGLRLGLGRGVIGVIVAEMFASHRGIGRLMVYAAAAVQTNELLFLTLLTSIFGILLVRASEYVEGRFAPWLQKLKI